MTASPNAVARAGRIAVLLPSLEGGGAEWCMLKLVRGFLDQGREVDLVLCQAKGAYMDSIPDEANLVVLKAAGPLMSRVRAAITHPAGFQRMLLPVVLAKKSPPEPAYLDSLIRYIDSGRADVVVSALSYANLLNIWARGRSKTRPPVLVSERNAIATHCAMPENHRKWRWRYLPDLVRHSYPEADGVITVSNFVKDELVKRVGLCPDSINTIYNPVVDDELLRRAAEPLKNDWFAPGAPPVVLGVGRLTEQKDFATLMRAFSLVRQQREARLVLLGEGRLRQELESLARELGIAEDVRMPGFVPNPIRYMARAGVLVSSSEYEGLPGVLIQALAAGCPVVATDCRGGSREIVADGKYGALVQVGDHQAMAAAIEAELGNPTDRETLTTRARAFCVTTGVDRYLNMIDATLTAHRQRAS